MTCQDRDADLLLLAHGELGFAARVRTRTHVERCPRCRKRIAEFGVVSAALASALGPTVSERTGRKQPKPAMAAGPVLTVAALLIVIGVSLFLAIRAILPEITPPGTYYYYRSQMPAVFSISSSRGSDACATPVPPHVKPTIISKSGR